MKIRSTPLLLVAIASVSFLMGWLLSGKGSLAQDQSLRSEGQMLRPGDSIEEQINLPPSKSGIGVVGNMAFVVHKVEPGSPAEQLGIQKGDLITEWNGRQIISIKDFMFMGQLDPGQTVMLEFVRPNFATGKFQTFTGKAALAANNWGAAPK
jgi:S1-C subfamily serine protease